MHIKRLQVEQKKEKETKEKQGKCAYMCEQTSPRHAQVVLTATMHDVGIRCVDLGHVALQLHFTCSATLFLSFEVHACWDSAVDFTGKKVVSVVAIFKIEVACDFYVTTSWGVFRLLGSLKRAPSTALRPTVGCIAARIQTFSSYLSLKLSVRSLHACADLP